jgi:hypothetical protein
MKSRQKSCLMFGSFPIGMLAALALLLFIVTRMSVLLN